MKTNPEITKEFLGRWANNSLSAEELRYFETHKEYAFYQKIFNTSANFQIPEFNKEESYRVIKQKLNYKNSKILSPNFKTWIAGIAASVLVVVGLFFAFRSNDNNIETLVAETALHTLPDGSIVQLNANSLISYNKKSFLKKRKIQLKGEAYFKVAKGSKFTVQTTKADVSVLGTEFNIVDREGIFEANCYEGKVAVTNKKYNEILTANKGVRFLNDKLILLETGQTQPQWILNISSFKKVPLYVVINELENQYPIQIDASSIDQSLLISTSFSHENLQEALQTVFEPMNIKFTFTSSSEIELK